MLKKGQLSVIMIIGLLLVIATAFIVYNGKAPTQTIIPEQFRPVQGAITSCLQTTLEAGILLAGVQGGYTNVPADVKSVTIRNAKIPFWYTPAAKLELTDTAVEQQLARFLNSYAPRCVNMSAFPGFTSTGASSADSKVVVTNDRVVATVTMPIKVTHGDATQAMDVFESSANIPLGNAISEATAITNAVERDKTGIDMTLQASMPTQNVVYNVSKDEKLVVIKDTAQTPTGAFIFAFAVGLADPVTNMPPTIGPIPLVYANVNSTQHIQINAVDPEGKVLLYDIISDKFTIDNKGVVTITAPQAGFYHATVRVEDDTGQTAYGNLEVIAS